MSKNNMLLLDVGEKHNEIKMNESIETKLEASRPPIGPSLWKLEPVEDFTLFPKLPLELRTEIWKYALPGSRDILVTGSNESFDIHLSRDDRATVIPTALLHTNREARSTALKIYKPCSGPWGGNPIYFDFKENVLFTRRLSGFYALCGVCPLTNEFHIILDWQLRLQHLRITRSYNCRLNYTPFGAMVSLKTIAFGPGELGPTVAITF
ncbi:hypothetical protein BKA61DRAFT_700601 [Leptodontidium sp. MPI-SDFR-AT-0119]|nr:hypothetical protein BKA61DRAFT_700601 [Leptodontidium sp. MPI-SDFR-AT-0119]